MTPKKILITGATDGLGKALSIELAKEGHYLLLHGRSQQRLDKLVGYIKNSFPSAQIKTYLGDFSLLKSVYELSDKILAQETHLNVLVNNAGMGAGKSHEGRQMSHDNYELRFQVNYLSTFLLTRSLLPLLKASASQQEDTRIVNVASVGQQKIDFDDMMLKRNYSGIRAYSQSKLAMIMFSFDLAEELKPFGITVNALHPATLMPTKMTLEAFGYGMASIEEGLQATKRLITSQGLANFTGEYFDGQQISKAHYQAYDSSARDLLKSHSLKFTELPLPSAQL